MSDDQRFKKINKVAVGNTFIDAKKFYTCENGVMFEIDLQYDTVLKTLCHQKIAKAEGGTNGKSPV